MPIPVRYLVIALTASCQVTYADQMTDALWMVFQKSPHMIDECATKLASAATIDRHNGWPAYCNEFENTEIVQSRVRELRSETAAMSASDKKHIASGSVRIGMTAKAAEAAWGRPKSINRTTGSWGTKEQWVYGDGNYLYILNGKIEAIQN